ncbi:hypothetical protein MMC29_000802, partial [Sticta canariensis]|nr:hypothetical protein [Sticta canariensis]
MPTLISSQAQQVLVDDFKIRKSVAVSFPPLLKDDTNYKAGKDSKDKTTAGMKMVSASCGLLIKSGIDNAIGGNCPLFEAAIRSRVFSGASMDQYDIIEDSAIFCGICFATTAASKPPNFGRMNAVNTTCCHQFPTVLNDLILVEEAVIAHAHPVISILKSRPAGRASPQSTYEGIRGHAVVFPQNTGPLSNMLPSSTIQVQDIIRVVWASDEPYTEDQLRPFIT